MNFGIIESNQSAAHAVDANHKGWIPARIRLAEYPQLKQLAWQVHGIGELTPMEALSIYERNWRHLNAQALETHERQLIEALRIGFGEPDGIV